MENGPLELRSLATEGTQECSMVNVQWRKQIVHMTSFVPILCLALLKTNHQLGKVLTDHTTDIPFIHHLDDTMQFYFLAFRIVSKIERSNAKLIKQASFNQITFFQ